jgi:hypothetical protein
MMARPRPALVCAIIGAALPATPAAAAEPPVRPGAPVSSHAMVHTCCTSAAMKERIFAESKAMGARFIRVGVELHGIFLAGLYHMRAALHAQHVRELADLVAGR